MNSFQVSLSTERLVLKPLTINDSQFIRELVNTPGWLRFIGERNVHSEEDAVKYIQKILSNPNINYWVVKARTVNSSLGVVTLIKRNYLEYHDIGFAFLPDSFGRGYAKEAALSLLNHVFSTGNHSHIQAITLPDNQSSIALLEKLGFVFETEIEEENEKQKVYITTAVLFEKTVL